jgi:hypothetical protein
MAMAKKPTVKKTNASKKPPLKGGPRFKSDISTGYQQGFRIKVKRK